MFNELLAWLGFSSASSKDELDLYVEKIKGQAAAREKEAKRLKDKVRKQREAQLAIERSIERSRKAVGDKAAALQALEEAYATLADAMLTADYFEEALGRIECELSSKAQDLESMTLEEIKYTMGRRKWSADPAGRAEQFLREEIARKLEGAEEEPEEEEEELTRPRVIPLRTTPPDPSGSSSSSSSSVAPPPPGRVFRTPPPPPGTGAGSGAPPAPPMPPGVGGGTP